MKVTKEGYKRFEKEWDKQIPAKAEIYVGGKEETVKADDVNLKELIDKVAIWSERSQKGLCCGILGCLNDVISRCLLCRGGYCIWHQYAHMHNIKDSKFASVEHSKLT